MVHCTVTCSTTSSQFLCTRFTLNLFILELKTTFDGISPRGFQLLKTHKEQLIFPEMVSSNSFTTTWLCQNYKPNCGTKNIKYIKMASNKNEQNTARRDLKRTNCTINLPLVFTILVYFVSWDSFIPKYRHYDIAYCYIIVPNKSHTLCCRRKEASIFQAF